ncbi:MAG: dienelactone hydrolase family protein [Polyangia bacterium]
METAITTERITVHPDDGSGPMGCYLARPEGGGRHPGVLLFMEIFGINSHIRDVAARIARLGYVVLAPDTFHRTGPGIELGYNPEGFSKGMPLLKQLKRDEVLSDLRAAYEALHSRADVTGPIGAIGFCIGGHLTYLAAASLPIQAAASFYGGGIAGWDIPLNQPAPTITLTPGIAKNDCRILCLFGEKDGMIPAAQRTAIATALTDAGARHEIVVYPDADHGFFCDQRGSFHAPSRDDAWQRVQALFAEELGGKHGRQG